ncbi:MAG: DUF6588 family protein [Adhaeribacter sp.]
MWLPSTSAKKTAFLFFLLGPLLAGLPARAQFNAGDLVRGGTANARKLLHAYGEPLNKGLAAGLNAGWQRPGEAFKTGRFELRLLGTVGFPPPEDRTFDVTRIGLDDLVQPENPARVLAPTVFNKDEQGLPMVVYGTRPDTGERVRLAGFNTAPGLGIEVAPLPMAQLHVGLIANTELMVRYVPTVTFSDNQVSLWGLGLKNHIGELLPLLSELPVDVIGTVGYTEFQGKDGLGVRPEAGVPNPNPGDYSTQRFAFDTKAWYGSLVVSKNIGKALALHAGLSYSKSTTETALTGTYPITVIRQQAPYTKEIANLTDPLRLEFDHGQVGLTGGLRLKFSLFSFNLEGTWAEYPTVNAGLGLGWN